MAIRPVFGAGTTISYNHRALYGERMWVLAQLPPTRASLVARLADPADAAAWDEFVAAYGGLVFSEVRRRGFDHADAEDLTQRVFTRVFKGLKSFDYDPQRGRFRDWLGTIVRHEVIRDFRTRSRKTATLLPPEELDAVAESGPDAEWTEAFQAHVYGVALEKCRPRFEAATWAAFEAVWRDGRTAAEAATLTGLTVENVYVSKSRVLSALSAMILTLSDDLPSFDPAA
jgi:RNA polymerase sigma factor (sigma-70 family)